MRLKSIRFWSAPSLGVVLIALTLSLGSCSKINICGQENKLFGDWAITEYSIGDSSVLLFDPSMVPIDYPIGAPLNPFLSFQESGALFYFQFGDTIFSSYRMDRYEQKCLLYSDLFEYRWVITKLSSSKMDIESWYLAGPDSLLTTTYSLEKR